jgi:hypothetical protein
VRGVRLNGNVPQWMVEADRKLGTLLKYMRREGITIDMEAAEEHLRQFYAKDRMRAHFSMLDGDDG